jgi:hypothetical protein
MSNASVLPLVMANVILAGLVLAPAVAIGVSVARRILSRPRAVRYVDIPGVGRIPVLAE